MTWDPIRWVNEFRQASAEGAGFRELRQEVFHSTAIAVAARRYFCEGLSVPLDDAGQYDALHRRTVMYARTDDLIFPEAMRGVFDTAVTVTEADCLELARMMQHLGLDPIVLNMASRRNPGGGVLGGAGAQEENLFRRSNLLYSLYQFVDFSDEYGVPRSPSRSYPIGRESGAIYSPRATVFRSSESTGYAFLREPYPMSFVSVPAIPDPQTETRNDRLWLTQQMARATKKKLRAILRVAAHHGHDSAVLSAFGCGAFRNPPHHMATLFAQVFDEPEFRGVFRVLSFAIIDDHNAWRGHNPEGNLIPFQRVFEDRLGTDPHSAERSRR
jgi:uncharacterized protein (TIGR02452 family)